MSELNNKFSDFVGGFQSVNAQENHTLEKLNQ